MTGTIRSMLVTKIRSWLRKFAAIERITRTARGYGLEKVRMLEESHSPLIPFCLFILTLSLLSLPSLSSLSLSPVVQEHLNSKDLQSVEVLGQLAEPKFV